VARSTSENADPKDRGGLQCLQGVVGKEAQPAQDRQAQARREGRLRDLGPPARGRDRALLDERPEQLGGEQRVACRSRDLREQPRTRIGGDRVRHQLMHGPIRERAEGEAPGPGGLQRAAQPFQFRNARGGPQASNERDLEVGEASAHRGQREQAGRIGPLQVVHADHQRPGQRELLGEVGECVHGAELQPRIAGYRDRTLVAASVGGQQRRDGRPPRVR
jgi:hypothetical protein